MGHVPPGPLPADRQGAHVPRRQRRRAGTARALDLTDKRHLGEFGEALARWFLADHGIRVLASNLKVDRGEVDILANDHGTRVVVEVRAVTGGGDPIDAVDHEKRRQVSHLATRVGATRVDFIGVRIATDAAVFHWVPGWS